MKKIVVLVLLIFAFNSAYGVKVLIVVSKSKQNTFFSITEEPVIKMKNTTVLVYTSSYSLFIPKEEILKFVVVNTDSLNEQDFMSYSLNRSENDSGSSVEIDSLNHVGYSDLKQTISKSEQFLPITNTNDLELYTIDGMYMGKYNNLPAGMYIFKKDGVTYKIFKK